MRFILEIECGNAAFDDGNMEKQVALILTVAARRVLDVSQPAVDAGQVPLKDVNGNTVGSMRFED